MNLTDEKVSQAMAAVMGIYWHEPTETRYHTEYGIQRKCKHCGHFFDDNDQFSAFTPDGIWQWKTYMEREMPKTWETFLVATRWHVEHPNKLSQSLNDFLDPRKLVEFLLDDLFWWGYVECGCADTCGNEPENMIPLETLCHTNRQVCTGKVLTERAKRFKAIVEGEGE
jgi:hypothetical protein